METELTPTNHAGSPLAALKTSPSQYLASLAPRTVEDVFNSGHPALATVQKEVGLTKTRAVVAYLIAETLEFFNSGNDMNDRQVAMTVDLIIEEYPYMQPDDLKLCFRGAMKGRYGKLYNRIDGQIIMGWLREYNRERCTAADRHSYNEHKAHLSEEAKPTEGIFYAEYRAELERRAQGGNDEAKRLLALSDGLISELERRKHDKAKEDLDRFYGKVAERKIII